MPKPPTPNQTSQEIILATSNDDTKDWLTRVIESAERQYRALEMEGKWHERKDSERRRA